ncbi:MAG: DMT family transporter [Solirubrobacteraceae bacterium]
MSSRGWAAFAAMSVLFGIPYLFVKVAVDGGVPPALVAWGRVALAAVVLLALAGRAGTLRSLRGRWRWLAAYTVVEIAVPFPMIAFGEQHVSSSLAAIVIASVPLIIAVLAVRFDHAERPNRLRLTGLLIGFSGVVVLVGIDVAGQPDELLGTAAILVAAVGYAIGPLILKHRLLDLDQVATMGASLGLATVFLTPLAILTAPSATPSGDALVSVAVLGLFCTALAFVVFSALIREAGPSRALVITYVNPVVAVALGVAVLGERPGPGAVAGLLLILAGSWLSTGGGLPPRVAAVFTPGVKDRGAPGPFDPSSAPPGEPPGHA